MKAVRSIISTVQPTILRVKIGQNQWKNIRNENQSEKQSKITRKSHQVW